MFIVYIGLVKHSAYYRYIDAEDEKKRLEELGVGDVHIIFMEHAEYEDGEHF